MHEQSVQAQEQARGLLLTLILLVRAVRDGGQVSELRLGAVLDDVLRLLHELGGFDGVIRQFQHDLGRRRSP